MRNVIIVHGWSDTSKSFQPLAAYLAAHGYHVVDLWLGEYISLDDDVQIPDVAKRMEEVLRQKIEGGEIQPPFDLVVHSTGGLVAREWLASYHGGNIAQCPAKRLVMLAPANFGSKLASMGQSMLGRVVKGWKNWFHTGKEMLRALELASPYQWDLAQRDLFVPAGAEPAPAVYGPDGVWPFIITGTHPYPSMMREIVNEDGSDGTVRVPAANLNTRGITIDFASNEDTPILQHWQLRHGDFSFPLAVLPDRTHASVTTPEKADVPCLPGQASDPGNLILAALNCTTVQTYRTLVADWAAISERTAALAKGCGWEQVIARPGKASQMEPYFHQYMQVNVRVVDDHGTDVADYFLEFSGPDEERGNRSTAYFHRHVLENVHVNGTNPALRCLYADRTDLVDGFYASIAGQVEKVLYMSISAAPPGGNISYFDNYREGARGSVALHGEDEAVGARWLQRNTTHFVKIIIPRCPKDNVFKLTPAPR